MAKKRKKIDAPKSCRRILNVGRSWYKANLVYTSHSSEWLHIEYEFQKIFYDGGEFFEEDDEPVYTETGELGLHWEYLDVHCDVKTVVDFFTDKGAEAFVKIVKDRVDQKDKERVLKKIKNSCFMEGA